MARNSRLKDHHAEQRMFARRVVAASIVIMVLLGALFARLFYLQVVRHEYFSELSQGNRIRIEPIPPPRGLILDRNGEPLALNRPAYQLELTREQTPDLDDTLQRLVALELLPAEDVARTRRTIMARRALRRGADPPAADRGGTGALRGAPAGLPGRRDPAAADAALSLKRRRRARARLRRRDQRAGPGAHRRGGLRGHDADRQARHRAQLRGGAARRHRLPAAAGERAGPARRPRRHQVARPRSAGSRSRATT